jgi:hypothetical protein
MGSSCPTQPIVCRRFRERLALGDTWVNSMDIARKAIASMQTTDGYLGGLEIPLMHVFLTGPDP